MDLSELITAALAGLESLRTRGLVDPQGFFVSLEGSQIHWQFFKFSALPGHPSPGNATNRMPPANMTTEKAAEWRRRQRSLYSRPADISCFDKSQGRIANPFSEKTTQREVLEAAKQVASALFGDEIVELEIARYIGPGEIGVTAYELPEGRIVRYGDDDADLFPLSEFVVLRHGRTCWEEYPRAGTVDLQPDFEGMLGFVVDEEERKRIDDETI